MQQKFIRVGPGFWNIRGSFRIGGVIDVGTQASLVQRANGKFVFLDACAVPQAVLREIHNLTDGGKRVEAILHLHPFHTLHAKRLHELFPQARLHGTARHLQRQPELPWEAERTESNALHALFADDFEFSVPAGVDFISADDNVHFSSVLAWHRASKTIHVDDTLMYVRMPLPVRLLGLTDTVRFHPTLSKALHPNGAAAAQFRAWASGLAKRWRTAENLCAAHVRPLLAADNDGDPIRRRIEQALDKVDTTLTSHERRQQAR